MTTVNMYRKLPEVWTFLRYVSGQITLFTILHTLLAVT